MHLKLAVLPLADGVHEWLALRVATLAEEMHLEPGPDECANGIGHLVNNPLYASIWSNGISAGVVLCWAFSEVWTLRGLPAFGLALWQWPRR